MSRSLSFRRPTRTELAVAAMALLLGVLAVLQYRWVGQLSTDERERLRSHADNQAESLSRDPARLEVVAWPTELEPMRVHLQQALEGQRHGTAPVRLFSTFAAV